MSASPAPPLLLASTSPQRRAILDQLGLPFDTVAPRYEELGDDPLEHAAGKARSVDGGERPVVGVDTVVRCGDAVLGKPPHAGAAEEMLELLSGRTHEVVSGLCLRTQAWEELRTETTLVTFRALTARDLAWYLAAGEWEGRAGHCLQHKGRGPILVLRLGGVHGHGSGLPSGYACAAARGRLADVHRSQRPGRLGWLGQLSQRRRERSDNLLAGARYWRLLVLILVASDGSRLNPVELGLLQQESEALAHGGKHLPSPQELASRTGSSLEHLTHLQTATRTPVSLNAVLDDDSDFKLTEAMPDNQSNVLQQNNERQEALSFLMENLRPRERKVLDLRFGLTGNGTHSLRQIGHLLRISKERVRQIQNRALEKLKAAAERVGWESNLLLE